MFKGCCNKHGYNFDDVSKIGYSRPLKIKEFWMKAYDIIISVNDVTKNVYPVTHIKL